MEEIVGTYQATRYCNEQQDFLVGFLESGETVTGAAKDKPEPGMTYRWFGTWKTSPKYGRQFKFVVFTSHEPHSRESVVLYLTKILRGTGLGKVAAIKLWDAYQSDAVRVLRTQSKAVAEQCGFDLEKCHEAASRLDAHKKSENTTVDLMGLFAGRGFPMATIRHCIERWGSRAPAIVRRDPFALMIAKIPGCGFARCDTLYQSLGLDLAKMKRQAICFWHGIATRGTGDTWHTMASAVEALEKKICGIEVNAKKAAKICKRAKWIELRRDEANALWVAEGKESRHEQAVADRVVSLMQSRAAWPEPCEGLSDHQAEQVRIATSAPIGILSGTPGTGKTYSAAAIIKGIVASHGFGAVGLMAPTGKAAVRLTESLTRAGLVGMQAMTIHRALLPTRGGYGTDDWGFAHHADNPLAYQFILVDESSMIDTNLMACLLRAVSMGTRILLIGDPNQLPPVGHGAPFRDLIASGLVPHGSLTEVRRNSGLIVEACRSIREQRRVVTCVAMDDDGNNLRAVSASSSVAVINTIRAVFESVTTKGDRDPIEDLQVLVPMNENGSLGRKKLNGILQNILNANGRAETGNPFREADKVICTGNGWYPSATEQGMTEFLANGDIGRITSVSPTNFEALFPSIGDGPRLVRIPLKTEWADKFELAYAITCHKSQGSEWPVVIVLADESASRMASREWWYTAISRAKDRCLVIGRMAVVESQCRKLVLDKRKTFLVERIHEWTNGTQEVRQRCEARMGGEEAPSVLALETNIQPAEPASLPT